MHHSGCTSRQLTPFEIRCLRPTISRSPGDQGGPVRWLGYQLDTCHPPSTKRILQHVTGNPVVDGADCGRNRAFLWAKTQGHPRL
jgi:hypothetical protein